jgi:hypothetical protein
MKKILAKDLKMKFVEKLSKLDSFAYDQGNPFLIKLGYKRFFVFLKNLSPAYFKNSPDITRVQLPYSDHFERIVKANVPFLILGYDVDHDTFVAWDPAKVKERLNAKSNVSLYSRESLQQGNFRKAFMVGHLSNGDKIIIFKREFLPDFLYEIEKYFSISQKVRSKVKEIAPASVYATDKIYEIKDKSLLKQIRPLLRTNRVLEAVSICSKFYGNKYSSMNFKDWFNIVNKLYQNNKN